MVVFLESLMVWCQRLLPSWWVFLTVVALMVVELILSLS